MKTATFIDRLRNITVSGYRSWWLEEGAITSHEDDLCPIHEVCLATFNRRWRDVFKNGKKLGLSKRRVKKITDAADGREGYDPILRARLLEACALTETPQLPQSENVE